MADVTEDLLDLESRRCAAISAGDVEALRALLSDDYVHVHMTGALDDRAGHLEAISGRPRVTTRGTIKVRTYGDLAVLTGELTNAMAGPDRAVRETRAFCHQVAVKGDGGWRFVSVQLTPMAQPAAG